MVARGTMVQFNKFTINMVLGLQEVEDTYQKLLSNVDKYYLEVLKDSLCLEGMTWSIVQKSADKMVIRMQLRSVPKVWYQFLKYFVMPAAYNEYVNKARLLILHNITSNSPVDIA